MGPINGEINMAPIITAVELLIKPIDATIIEHIKIQMLIALKDISFLMSSTVCCLSTTSYIENNFLMKSNKDLKALETVNTMQPTVSHKTYKTSKHSSKVTQYFFPNFNENNKVTGTISFAVISEIK